IGRYMISLMQITTHTFGTVKAAEVQSTELRISDVHEALDLMGDLYYQGFDMIILQRQQLAPEFFDLKSKLAGEILQKFSNYRMRLAILGDFDTESSGSFRDFVRESNQGKQVQFVRSLEDVQ